MRKLVLGLAIFLFTGFSWGISKIGGSSITSPNNGFTLSIPIKFNSVHQVDDDLIRLVGPPSTIGGEIQPQLIELNSFDKVYPSMTKLNRTYWTNYFAKQNGTHLVNGNRCIEAFRFETPTAVSIIASWGQGKGIVLMGINSPDGTTALQQMYDSLTIDANACGW